MYCCEVPRNLVRLAPVAGSDYMKQTRAYIFMFKLVIGLIYLCCSPYSQCEAYVILLTYYEVFNDKLWFNDNI